MSLFGWHGQPRGYRKCPVAYNAAAHADPLSERIVGKPEIEPFVRDWCYIPIALIIPADGRRTSALVVQTPGYGS